MKLIKISLAAKSLAVLSLLSILTSSCIAQNKPPQCDTDEHRQFDFWVGDWVVTDKEGNIQGYNKVDLILENCTLFENWRGAQGSEGKSFNFYDRANNQWHQTWIDKSGGVLYLDGSLKGNAMVLSGNRPGREGGTVLHKISYTPMEDGQVEQHWQFSKDNGQSWQDLFLGIYKKRSSEKAM